MSAQEPPHGGQPDGDRQDELLLFARLEADLADGDEEPVSSVDPADCDGPPPGSRLASPLPPPSLPKRELC